MAGLGVVIILSHVYYWGTLTLWIFSIAILKPVSYYFNNLAYSSKNRADWGIICSLSFSC